MSFSSLLTYFFFFVFFFLYSLFTFTVCPRTMKPRPYLCPALPPCLVSVCFYSHIVLLFRRLFFPTRLPFILKFRVHSICCSLFAFHSLNSLFETSRWMELFFARKQRRKTSTKWLLINASWEGKKNEKANDMIFNEKRLINWSEKPGRHS